MSGNMRLGSKVERFAKSWRAEGRRQNQANVRHKAKVADKRSLGETLGIAARGTTIVNCRGCDKVPERCECDS